LQVLLEARSTDLGLAGAVMVLAGSRPEAVVAQCGCRSVDQMLEFGERQIRRSLRR
jgi:hypothetical protein